MNEIKYYINLTTPSGDGNEWENTTYPTFENGIMKFKDEDDLDVVVYIGAATVTVEEMEVATANDNNTKRIRND